MHGSLFSEDSLFRAMADADGQAAEHLIDDCFDHDFWWAPSRRLCSWRCLRKCPMMICWSRCFWLRHGQRIAPMVPPFLVSEFSCYCRSTCNLSNI